MSDHSRTSTLVVAIAITFMAGACTTGAPPTAAPGASPQAIPASGEVVLKAGTYTFDNSVLGLPGKPFPTIVITVPDGWTSFDGYVVHRYTGTPRYLGVSFWSVGDVYANGCHWSGHQIRPGPSVDDLAAVLASRPLRNATVPAAASFGGYHGQYLEWSVPGDILFSDCDGAMFKSWSATTGGDRYQQGPGQVDRLWILDIEGSRLVIDVTSMPATSELDRVELSKVLNSIAFKS